MADLSQYVPRLPYDTLGEFEPVSGVMVLNVRSDAYWEACLNYEHAQTKRDIDLYSTINHETYHYFQTIATGYQYNYVSDMWDIFIREANAIIIAEQDKKSKENHSLIWWNGFNALVEAAAEARRWEEEADKGGDLSIMRAQRPSLAGGFDTLWARVGERNAAGLSALDLIEGSAIVYQHALTHGRDDLEERLAEAWDAHGSTYRKAFEIAHAAYGQRTLDIMLPAIALALRYSDPPEAYPVFLAELNSASPGAELEVARLLANNPPKIMSAGRYLGSALEVWTKQRERPGRCYIYDDAMHNLATQAWGVDELDLLVEPRASLKVAAFPIPVVTNDGRVDGRMVDLDELTKRLILANVVLGTAKLPRYRKIIEQRLADRMHPILASLLDPLQAAQEYGNVGDTYAKEGDFDQAELMYSFSLNDYRLVRNQSGMASAYWRLADLHAKRGDFKKSEQMYQKSIGIYEEIGEREGLAGVSANLGVLYLNCKDWGRAEPLIRKALAIDQDLGSKQGMAIDYYNLALIRQGCGDLEKAETLFGQSAKLYQKVDNMLQVRQIQKRLKDLRNCRERAADMPH